jgi:hypothetical protein
VSSHLIVSKLRRTAQNETNQVNGDTKFTPAEIREDLVFFQDLLTRVHPPQIPSFQLGDIEEPLIEVERSVDHPTTRLGFYRRFGRSQAE